MKVRQQTVNTLQEKAPYQETDDRRNPGRDILAG
jgi:hypothetical protein